MTILSFEPMRPLPYGRIVRGDDGSVEAIVEDRDASPDNARSAELNSSIYVFAAGPLWTALEKLDPHNAQGELYLTDTIAHLVADGRRAAAWRCPDELAPLGINTRAELAIAAAELRDRINEAHMLAGVTIVDPRDRLDRPRRHARGRRHRPPVHGAARLDRGRCRRRDRPPRGRDRRLDRPGRDRGPVLLPSPRHRSRGGSKGGDIRGDQDSRASARGTKVPHLSYIGDADIGEDTNIAAGNVTANFSHEPGRPKGKTTIGKNVRTGVDNTFVAPVTVGDDAWLCGGNGRHGRRPAGVARRLPPAAGHEGRMGLRAWKGHRGWRRLSWQACRDSAPMTEHAQPQPGHWIERGPSKRLMVFSGRSHPDLAQRIADKLGVELGEIELDDVRERRDVLPLRRVDPRRRRLPRPDRLRAGRQEPDGAAADDPGGEARLRQADHRGRPALSRTHARTARRSRASRSPRASSRTCSSSPAPTAC